MATLTTAEKAVVQSAIDLLLESGSESPLDQLTIELLTPMQTKFGFGSGTEGLQIALQQRPFSTLLAALLAVAD